MTKIVRNLLVVLVLLASCVQPGNEVVQKVCINDQFIDIRDMPDNIPGETMGQKLESLLFWSQDEKERRFPIMHIIYPSVPIEAGDSVYELKEATQIVPKWKNNTTLEKYMNKNRIAGVIAVQNDEVKLEVYNEGVDQNMLWTSYSVAKSMASMLVGAALKDGYIKSMDDELGEYIPELKDYDYGKVTVRQLLTMTSGIKWNEDYFDANSDVAVMYHGVCEGDEAHIITYMKSLEQVNTPGEHWNYNTGETDLVGILIDKATGMSLAEYISEKIWKPFGMQQCGYWLADECSGFNIGGSGMSASLRDYARLGLLMLRGGVIDGESIFADEWVKDATNILIRPDVLENGGYGYLWWINNDGSYTAEGLFGQLIYVNPALNLVVAQIAAWPEAGSNKLMKNRNEFVQAVIQGLN